MKTRIALALVFSVIASALAIAAMEPSDEHPELAKIKKLYQSEMEPIQKKLRARLEAAQRDLTRKGDLSGALAVKTELEHLAASDKAASRKNQPPLFGTWTITYGNGVIRNYIIEDDGTVKWVEDKKSGQIVKRGEDILIDFNDGNLERIAIKEVLYVEHFSPKAKYESGAKMSVFGAGLKDAAKEPK